MKESKKEVNYTKLGSYRCSECRHARFDARCSIVKGKIDPKAGCDRFREPEVTETTRGFDALENM